MKIGDKLVNQIQTRISHVQYRKSEVENALRGNEPVNTKENNFQLGKYDGMDEGFQSVILKLTKSPNTDMSLIEKELSNMVIEARTDLGTINSNSKARGYELDIDDYNKGKCNGKVDSFNEVILMCRQLGSEEAAEMIRD